MTYLPIREMTYQQAAQSALDVQNACNGSGVVFSFAQAMQAICNESHKRGEGTEWRNRHPIVTLYLSKLADLNGSLNPAGIPASAYDEVKRIAAGDEWQACTRAANRLADLVCAMHYPGDEQARKTFPTATWAEMIASELGIEVPVSGE